MQSSARRKVATRTASPVREAETIAYVQPEREHRAQAKAEPDPETAAYIAQITAELTAMAAKANLETLAYLLAMARVEAELMSRE